MLPELHTALRTLLHEHGRINPLEVDIRFDAPTRERIERQTVPTINFYLTSILENVDLRATNHQTRRVNGFAERRVAPRRVDVQYMVSALTTDTDDEHRLLWRTLATLLRHQQLPEEVLPPELRGLEPAITTKVAQPDDSPNLLEIWSALGVEPRPALAYTVTVPLDLEFTLQAPLVLTRTVRYLRGLDANREVADTGVQIGGVVRTKDGEPIPGATVTAAANGEGSITGPDGWFTLRNITSGTVQLHVTPPDGEMQAVEIEVPSERYEIVVTSRRNRR